MSRALKYTHSPRTSQPPSQRRVRAWLVKVTGAFGLVTLASGFALLLTALPAQALTTISQSFSTKDKLSSGSIVSLNPDTPDQVSAAKNDNADSILGVVINDNSSLLSLTNGQADQVQVATSGVIQVLASDINGKIAQGDQVTASPINGVGMKATSSVKVVGIAQAGLPDDKAKQTYKDKDGQEKTVSLGQIPVLVNVSYYYKQPEKTIIPSAVQNVANALAGKAVSPLPILISGGIFIITLIVVVSIIYSIIHGSIISVGRNPMSQSAIYRNILHLSALIVGILGVSIAAIYLILTKL